MAQEILLLQVYMDEDRTKEPYFFNSGTATQCLYRIGE
jgi:hypothetical protein